MANRAHQAFASRPPSKQAIPWGDMSMRLRSLCAVIFQLKQEKRRPVKCELISELPAKPMKLQHCQ